MGDVDYLLVGEKTAAVVSPPLRQQRAAQPRRLLSEWVFKKHGRQSTFEIS